MKLSKRVILKHLSVFAFYLGMAVAITWPLVSQLTTHLYGAFLTDATQSARHTWWIKHALQTGQPLFDQSLLGYPDGLSGAWLWANPLEYFPGWLFAFVMPLTAAANLMVLLWLALDGWAMYLLVNRLTGDRHYPALVAGLTFMCFPALQSRIYGGHVGLLALWPVPLYLYALQRLDDGAGQGASRRWYALAAICFALGMAGNSTLLVYVLLPTAGVVLLARLVERDGHRFRRALIATALGGLLALVLLLPLALETAHTPQYNPDIGGSVTYSADLLSVVSPSFLHPLYKHLDYPGHVLGTNLLEGTGYIGIVSGLMAVVAVLTQRRARWWLLLAGIAWLFSLGPLLKIEDTPLTIDVDGFTSYVPLPWGVLQKLPVLAISRTPGRFNLTVALAVAVMVGYGTETLWGRIRTASGRYLMVAGLMALIFLDTRMFWPMPTTPAPVPDAVSALAQRDDIRAVFNIPWNDRLHAKTALFLQAYHQQPIVAGQFIRDTPVNPARLAVLQGTLDPAILDRAGVDVVILHKKGTVSAGLPDLSSRWPDDLLYQDDRLAIYNVPDVAYLAPFEAVLLAGDTITTQGDSYMYAPGPGWATFTGTISSSTADPVTVALLWEGEAVHRWQVGEPQRFEVALPVGEEGFYTARLQLVPVCPRFDHPALLCKSLSVQDLAMTWTPGLVEPVTGFGQGIDLAAAYVHYEASAGGRLPVHLWWRFDQPADTPFESLSRFVHVLDADGQAVAQADGPLNLDRALSQWIDSPEIVLPEDLPAGQYRVVVGWYRYPSMERLAVQADTPEAVNGLIEIGTFNVNP
jgi:hypothetical protein